MTRCVWDSRPADVRILADAADRCGPAPVVTSASPVRCRPAGALRRGGRRVRRGMSHGSAGRLRVRVVTRRGLGCQEEQCPTSFRTSAGTPCWWTLGISTRRSASWSSAARPGGSSGRGRAADRCPAGPGRPHHARRSCCACTGTTPPGTGWPRWSSGRSPRCPTSRSGSATSTRPASRRASTRSCGRISSCWPGTVRSATSCSSPVTRTWCPRSRRPRRTACGCTSGESSRRTG